MSYNKENCNKWHINPLINPFSNRPIKKDGPIYKTFQKECANILKISPKKNIKINKNPIYNTDNCNKWHTNPLINPFSNKPIKKDGPIYKTFQKECTNILKLSSKIKSYNTDTDLCKKWINNKLINPKTNKPIKLNGPIYKQYLLKCAKLLVSTKSHKSLSSSSDEKPKSLSSSNDKKSKSSSSSNDKKFKSLSSSNDKKSKSSSSSSDKKPKSSSSSSSSDKKSKSSSSSSDEKPKSSSSSRYETPKSSSSSSDKKPKSSSSSIDEKPKSSSSSNDKKPSSSSNDKKSSSSSNDKKSSSSSSSSDKKSKSSSSSIDEKSKSSSSSIDEKPKSSSSSSDKKPKSSSSSNDKKSSSRYETPKISSSLQFKTPSSGYGSSKKYLKSNKEGSSGNIRGIVSNPYLKYKKSSSSQYYTGLTRSFKSTPFSKSSTKNIFETANESFKINSSNDIILAFIEKRINNYNILNKYISKINSKYSNNCIKKYKNISGHQLLRIGNKIILKKKLGQSGGYGVVYKGYYRANKRDDYNYDINFAVKICQITEDNKKEIEIAKILTDKVINDDFANYPILYGYLKCNSDELNDLYSSENSSGSLNYSPQSLFSSNYNSLLNKNQLYFQIYEIADGTLNNYFAYIIDDDTDKIKSNEFVFNALAQVFMSLICFYCHTDMCHADTHFGNFLYYKITPGGKPFEYRIFNNTLSIENIGYLWVINDFGLAEKFIDGKIISQILKDFKLIIQELLYKKSYFIDDEINKFIKKINDYLDIDLYLIDDFETLLINIINCLLEYSETFKLIV